MRLDIGGGRSRIVAAASLCAVALVAAGTVAAAPAAQAATGCSVAYSVSSQWPGGFGANVTVTNLGDPVSGWTLTWTFGAGQTITSLWNGVVTQSGSSVSVKDTGWNSALGTGGTASFGFNGAFSGSNPAPSNFALNGTACTGSVGGGSTTTTTTTRSSSPVTTTTTTTSRPPTTTTTTTTQNGNTGGRSELVTPGGKCLDAGGTSNGSAARIATCNGSATQQWQYTGNREWKILNGSLCLDASGRGTTNGTPVIVWSCNGAANQQWTWGSNNTTIVGVGSGRCLDVPNGSTADGTTLQIYDCWGGDPQKWTLRTDGTQPTTTTTSQRTTTTTTSNNNNASGLYVDPSNAGSVWVNQNGGDYRASVIRNRITSQPQAIWITEGTNASASAQRAANYINAARSAGRIPMVVFYALPNRDCGGASAGGASDLNAYGQWVQTVSRQLGNQRVYVILEPDSLALQTCLSSSEAQARGNALSQAISTIKSANSQAKVYLDAGHSLWNSPSVTAQRLSQAGVSKADGFYTNVSNYQPTSNEISFGRQVQSALGNSNLKQIIDTSRNGGGAGSDWCDDNLPSSRRLGQSPTLNTGQSSVEAFMWIKLPGEADGCSKRPGTFYPENAYSLAGGNG